MNKRIVPFVDRKIEYIADVRRIVSACEKRGFYVTQFDAQLIWRNYSEQYCAGWLVLSGLSDDDIVSIVRRFGEEVTDV